MRNVSHGLRFFNVWFLADDAVWENILGVTGLLKEIRHWGRVLRVHSLVPLPAHSLLCVGS